MGGGVQRPAHVVALEQQRAPRVDLDHRAPIARLEQTPPGQQVIGVRPQLVGHVGLEGRIAEQETTEPGAADHDTPPVAVAAAANQYSAHSSASLNSVVFMFIDP